MLLDEGFIIWIPGHVNLHDGGAGALKVLTGKNTAILVQQPIELFNYGLGFQPQAAGHFFAPIRASGYLTVLPNCLPPASSPLNFDHVDGKTLTLRWQ